MDGKLTDRKTKRDKLADYETSENSLVIREGSCGRYQQCMRAWKVLKSWACV